MKLKIKILAAVMFSGFAAAFQRREGVLALGNAAAPPAPQQQQQKPESDLAAENNRLRKENERLKAGQGKIEKAIREKMEAGLSREQAEAACKHGHEFKVRFDKWQKDKQTAKAA